MFKLEIEHYFVLQNVWFAFSNNELSSRIGFMFIKNQLKSVSGHADNFDNFEYKVWIVNNCNNKYLLSIPFIPFPFIISNQHDFPDMKTRLSTCSMTFPVY